MLPLARLRERGEPLTIEAPGGNGQLTPRVASSAVERLVGLLGRRSLDEGECVLLSPCSSVHTIGMRFAIDVVYLDRDGMVLKVVRDLLPWRWSLGGRRARMVLELAAGEAKRLGIEPGMFLRPLP